MRSPIATLFDAADAPQLRTQVAELTNELATTRLELARTQADLKRETKRADFYFAYFCEETAHRREVNRRIAEDAWGLPGGG